MISVRILLTSHYDDRTGSDHGEYHLAKLSKNSRKQVMRDLKNVNSVDLSLVSTVKFGSETKSRLNKVDGSDPSDPSTSRCCFAALEPAKLPSGKRK